MCFLLIEQNAIWAVFKEVSVHRQGRDSLVYSIQTASCGVTTHSRGECGDPKLGTRTVLFTTRRADKTTVSSEEIMPNV